MTQHGYCAGVSRLSAIGSCELRTCPRYYVAARVGFEPMTLRSKGFDSKNAPPRPTSSFIHSEMLYSAPSRNYSEALPAQPRLRKEDLFKTCHYSSIEGLPNIFDGWITSKEHSSSGRSYQVDGPTTEKAQRQNSWRRSSRCTSRGQTLAVKRRSEDRTL